MIFKISAGKADSALARTKNTFKQKSKNAQGIIEKKYYESLHHEAKSRLAYMKFEKANQELADMDFDWSVKSFFNLTKKLFKMTNHKLNSVDHQTSAYSSMPERFWEPDNLNVSPERYYKVPKIYMPEIK